MLHHFHPVSYLVGLIGWLVLVSPTVSQEEQGSRQERLRGSITPERAWWDLKHYDLSLQISPDDRFIKGSNRITFEPVKPTQRMQVDLQEPLKLTRAVWRERELTLEREGNVLWLTFPEPLALGVEDSVLLHYEGKPVVSKNPPWSGGFSWRRDEHDNHFIATSCQGIGASIWWPCKDHGYDEPERGINTHFTVPEDLVAVSNGRLTGTDHDPERGTKTYHWSVTQPINNYSVNVNIGKYSNFSDTYEGEFGKLDLDYWVLEHQKETARKHFREAPRTLAAFEHWFGKYPFYEDSYKLVVVPYLGMEHQSSVTYGNGFQNGYRGTDLSATGVGMKFDFIIVHESGHEWFGNNISMKDAADMWIHESFTNYSENLFVEYHFSEQEAQDYVIGCRKRVRNDRPIIGTYNLNRSGSGDMYYKGGNMLHSLRHLIDDDELWRKMLIGLNTTFWHQTVTTQQVEDYLSEQAGIDLKRFFDQYLRTTRIPQLEHRLIDNTVRYRYANVVPGYDYRLKVLVNGKSQWIEPTESWQTLAVEADIESFEVDRNFYVDIVEVENQVLPLWPEGLPADAKPLDPKQVETLQSRRHPRGHVLYVDTPELHVFPAAADKANGCGVIVCPGGGYHVLAWQHEGVELAEWFNSLGVTAFVLKYRVPRRDPARIHWEPMQDVQRAIRLVRHRADSFDLSPNRIGVLGFSAGGHLTVMSGTQYETRSYPAVDEADQQSARPDFICPIYAAYLADGYRDNVAELGELVQVNQQTPPTFMAVTWDDTMRGAQAALLFARLKEHNVPAELHAWAKGGHGYGIRPSDQPVSQWHHQLEAWLRTSGFLARPNPTTPND